MRFDQSRGFRKSMSWVHTWGGLLAGWLLFAIFVTGTLSFFRQEITIWMQPELHVAKADSQGLARALAYLEKTAPDARRWSIEQPNPRSPVLSIGSSNSERERRGSQVAIDPATGDILTPRQTAGGRFFVTFHYQLHGMGPTAGRWIVGIVTMAMFVALITGVIIHRQIFKDFFTFRPGKGKRSWLDAHNATGILALPFYLVITFSGLLLLGTMLLPSINWAAYKGDPRGLHAEIRGQAPGGQRPGEERNMSRSSETGSDVVVREARAPREENVRAEAQVIQRHGVEAGQEHALTSTQIDAARQTVHRDGDEAVARSQAADAGVASEHRRPHAGSNGWSRPEHAGRQQGWATVNASEAKTHLDTARGAWKRLEAKPSRIPLIDLEPLLAQARERWPVNGVQGITITNPGKADAVVEIREVGAERLSNRGQPERLRFNGVTGEPLEETGSGYSTVRSIFATFQALHLGTFALPFARWLLFASGVLGCLMIASGLAVWVISRQKDCEVMGCKPLSYRLVEVLNVSAVAGVLVALAAYFWANRLIPGDFPERADWEIRTFLVVWMLTLLHAVLRPYKAGWIEQLGLAGVLSLLLPLLNAFTGGAHLLQSMLDGQWQVASFDCCALAIGGSLIWTALKIRSYLPRLSRPVSTEMVNEEEK